MLTTNGALAALSTELDFQTLTDLSLKPILQFLMSECITSMRASGLSVVDFMMQVLATNRERLNATCGVGYGLAQLAQPASSRCVSRFSSSATSASAPALASCAADASQRADRVQDLDVQVSERRACTSTDASRAVSFSRQHAQFQSDAPHASASTPDPALSCAVVDDGRSPGTTDSCIDYAKFISLNAKRRDKVHMQATFERYRDVEGGLSKTALMAALTEVDAPVLSSSDGAAEDSVFRRADTDSSNYIDLDECAISFRGL
jgi:hypothetical protein